MNILMAASEMEPLIETGPLAQVLRALSEELHKLGHKVSVVLPLYRSTLKDKKISPVPTGVRFSVPVGNQYMPCEIFQTHVANGLQIFFVGRDEFFDRAEPDDPQAHHSPYNPARFAFYARCVVELARRISPLPDVIQCHDWQASLIPAMVQDACLPFKTVLSISSLEHQGNFWSHDFAFTNLPDRYFTPATGLEFYGSLNFLKGGIIFSHAVVVPGKRFAIEAQRPSHGCGLDAVFREHSAKLHGIRYGLDQSTWSPKSDPLIRKAYTASDRKGKSRCSAELLSSLRLAPLPKGPIISLISPLVTPEGFDLLPPIWDRLLAEDIRIIVFGEAPQHNTVLKTIAHKYSSKFSYALGYDDSFIHQLFAGADIFLSPTDLELNGVTLMRALKYGAIPVICACSGFYEFLEDHDLLNNNGTGFVFYQNTSEALLDAIRRALAIFTQKDQWDHLVTNAMNKDFSWKASAQSHQALYNSLLDRFGNKPHKK